MDQDSVLYASNVSKRFCRDLKRSLWYGAQEVFRDALGKPPFAGELRKGEFWALNGVDLDIKRGEAVGLIGKNGSGKTTLLRVLSGLIKPTTGEITVRGRLAPLLALGAGFNPILTGKENIYANMALLGLTKEEIDERFEDIIAFSEIGYALDAPVQTYSSGMSARLGFACAIHTNPDVLLIDEVMAVGDTQFRVKCQRKLKEMRDEGTTFIITNHGAGYIVATCEKAIYLKGGEIRKTGGAVEVVEFYEEELLIEANERAAAKDKKTGKRSKSIQIRGVDLIDAQEEQTECLYTAEPGGVEVSFDCFEPIEKLHAMVRLMKIPSDDFSSSMRETMILNLPGHEDSAFYKVSEGLHAMRLRFPILVLVPGCYQFVVELYGHEDRLLGSRRGARFIVRSRIPIRHNEVFQPRKWAEKLYPVRESRLADRQDDEIIDASTALVNE